MRADVAHNVFGHSGDDALVQTHGDSIVAWDNLFSLNTMNQAGWCDFDRDGGQIFYRAQTAAGSSSWSGWAQADT